MWGLFIMVLHLRDPNLRSAYLNFTLEYALNMLYIMQEQELVIPEAPTGFKRLRIFAVSELIGEKGATG